MIYGQIITHSEPTPYEDYAQAVIDKCFVAGLRVSLATHLTVIEEPSFKKWLTMPLLEGMYLTDYCNNNIGIYFETENGKFETLYDLESRIEQLENNILFILSSTLAHCTRSNHIHAGKIDLLLKYIIQLTKHNPRYRIGLQ